jgi:hypothetical protein
MPTKERLADRNVTTTELALILGITGRRVQQLTQDGVLTPSAGASSSCLMPCKPTSAASPVAD